MARKMKDSGIEWIGEIPEGWEVIPIKYLARYNYDTLTESCSPDFEFNYIDIGSVTYGKGITTFQKFKFKDSPSRARRVVTPGDILISTVRTYLRAIACVNKSSIPQIASTGFLVLQADSSKLPPQFLMYAVLADSFICNVEAHSVGISYPAINASQIVHFKIPLPPSTEQIPLINYLDNHCSKIDVLLSKIHSSIEEYKKLKQAVIMQAVTKGVRGEREMKDSGVEWIGAIPKDWDILNLVAHTSMLTPMRDRPENLDGPIPWIRIEDFDGKYISSSKASLGVSKETVRSMNLKIYPVGTILCTSSCIMGKCAIVSRELVSNQRFIGIIPDQNTCENFLYYLMLSNSERMNYLATGALQANLSRSSFEHLKVQFPSYQEQKEISDYLDTTCAEIDKLIAKKEQLVKELECYKKSLIYEVVTGKREV